MEGYPQIAQNVSQDILCNQIIVVNNLFNVLMVNMEIIIMFVKIVNQNVRNV